MVSIEQYHAMHLPGKPQTTYISRLYPMLRTFCQASGDCRNGSIPPISRVLFRPPRLRMIERIIKKGIGQDTPIFSRKERSFDACSAKIDAKKCLHTMLLCFWQEIAVLMIQPHATSSAMPIILSPNYARYLMV